MSMSKVLTQNIISQIILNGNYQKIRAAKDGTKGMKTN
mgnify:CR=1 FL=1